MPLPVAIVTAESGGERSCSTGTYTYVSYSPPVVATPLSQRSTTGRLARESGAFSLSVLAQGQSELALRAARPGDGDKLTEQEIPAVEPPNGSGPPGVAGAVAVLFCEVESVVEVGAHTLVVGVVRESIVGEGEPLLRFRHEYRALGAGVAVSGEAPYPL